MELGISGLIPLAGGVTARNGLGVIFRRISDRKKKPPAINSPDLNTNPAQYRLAWDHGWLGDFSLEAVSSCYVYMFVFSQNGPLWWSFWGLRRKREATENTTLSVENTQVVMSRSLGKCGGQRPFYWALWMGKELSQLVQLQCLVEVGLLRDKSGQSTEWIVASIWPYLNERRENWLNCGLLL